MGYVIGYWLQHPVNFEKNKINSLIVSSKGCQISGDVLQSKTKINAADMRIVRASESVIFQEGLISNFKKKIINLVIFSQVLKLSECKSKCDRGVESVCLLAM